MTSSRLLRFGLGALALGLALVLVSAVVFTRGDRPSAGAPRGRSASVSASEILTSGDLTDSIVALQTRLRRVPSDSGSWAALGATYVQQARVTGDPTYYPKAQGAFRRSLQVLPHDNAPALTGLAALAAARHKFGASLNLARQSMRLNAYSSGTMAILVDSLVELGRYREAFKQLQRYVDLKPAVPSYTRVSYSYEIRGDSAGARYAMKQALNVAYSADDKAFALFQLGELEWNHGHLADAGRLYSAGHDADPAYVPNLYGLAKTAAASGDTRKALTLYRQVVGRFPQPQYVIEYSDFLTSLNRSTQVARMHELLDAQEKILRASGVNLDLELALYDASHGKKRQALIQARSAWSKRHSVFVEDAYAWALHVNGQEKAALRHALGAERLGTQSALLAFHRGMIEKALGKDPEARLSLQRCLDINPYFSPIFAPQARQALTDLRQDG